MHVPRELVRAVPSPQSRRYSPCSARAPRSCITFLTARGEKAVEYHRGCAAIELPVANRLGRRLGKFVFRGIASRERPIEPLTITLPSAPTRQRRIARNESFLPQFAPQISRNFRIERLHVLLDSLRLARPRDDRRDGGMSQAKLKSNGFDRHVVLPGESLDLLDLGENFLGRFRILE